MPQAVARTLDACLAGSHIGLRAGSHAGLRLIVALSGGRDSMALAHAVSRIAPERQVAVTAVHVHHGLSPNADAWAQACVDACRAWGLACIVQRVSIASDDPAGIEAAARRERYRALRAAATDGAAGAILLAHHQDDQAETVLLQLARGAGPRGLAGMARERMDLAGFVWHRPFLDLPRSAIEAYVQAHAIAYIEDESNASSDFRRNALRARIVPAWRETFGGYPGTLARTAALQAEAEELAGELARIDAAGRIADARLDRAGLAALSPARARNLLRHFLRLHGLAAPSQARLDAMLRQLCRDRPDARVRLLHDGAVLGVHRGAIGLHPITPPDWQLDWHGENPLVLEHGRLEFHPAHGEGIATSHLSVGAWQVRPRRGGERFRPHAKRPRRALKAWLAEAGLPPWERDALPLLFCGEVLVAVPGLGVDAGFSAAKDVPGLVPVWCPTT